MAWGYTAFGLERVGQGYDARLAPTSDAQIVDALLSHFVTSPSYAETARAMNERGYRFRNRREWARDAFGELSVALKQISPAMPSTGIPHDAGLIYQLLAIVIVGAKSYFT